MIRIIGLYIYWRNQQGFKNFVPRLVQIDVKHI